MNLDLRDSNVLQAIAPYATPRNIALTVLVSLICRLVYALYIRPTFLSPLRKMRGPPPTNVFFGMLPEIIRSKPGVPQKKWISEYGPTVRLRGPFGREHFMSVKPEVLSQILVSDWLDNPRPSHLRHTLGLVAGYGLLTTTGDEHKQMRKAMNPAFSITALNDQTDVYYDTADTLVELLRKDISPTEKQGSFKDIPVYPWVSKATLDIISLAAFGYKTDSLRDPHNELAEAFEQVLALQNPRYLFSLFSVLLIPGSRIFLQSKWAYKLAPYIGKLPLLSPLATIIKCTSDIRAISKRILHENAASYANPNDTHSKRDVLSLIVRAQAKDEASNYRMSEKVMIDQVLTFLGAGHETTASGLTWTLWLLAKSSSAQAKLRKEVSKVMAINPRPNYGALREMEWLDCVVMESLRLMPPVAFTPRVAARDQYLDGFLVPKGSGLDISLLAINTWKEVWGEDAEEFKPERWLNLPAKYNSTFSVLSFLAGPHACIGKTMAIFEMKALLISLVANFDFAPTHEDQTAQPTFAITMKPADDMPLRITIL